MILLDADFDGRMGVGVDEAYKEDIEEGDDVLVFLAEDDGGSAGVLDTNPRLEDRRLMSSRLRISRFLSTPIRLILHVLLLMIPLPMMLCILWCALMTASRRM